MTINVIHFNYFDLSYYFVHINYVFELCVWLRNFSLIGTKIKGVLVKLITPKY